VDLTLGVPGALGTDGQGAVLDVDVDAARVDARQVDVQHVVIAGAVQVERHAGHGRHLGLGRTEQLLHPPGGVQERVTTGSHANHLLAGVLRALRSTGADLGRSSCSSPSGYTTSISTLAMRVPVVSDGPGPLACVLGRVGP